MEIAYVLQELYKVTYGIFFGIVNAPSEKHSAALSPERTLGRESRHTN